MQIKAHLGMTISSQNKINLKFINSRKAYYCRKEAYLKEACQSYKDSISQRHMPFGTYISLYVKKVKNNSYINVNILKKDFKIKYSRTYIYILLKLVVCLLNAYIVGFKYDLHRKVRSRQCNFII
jgi:hypothetical protein